MSDVTTIINNAAEGSTVKIPPGIYTVLPRIKPRAGVTVDLTGVTLKIAAHSEYDMILIERPNVTLKGGTLIGDRAIAKQVEGGYGVRIKGDANNVTVRGTISTNMMADGFLIDGGKNITLDHVVGDNNRRQGLSICHGSDIRVTSSTFKNTNGAPPAAGIDLEPWKKTQLVKGVLITGCSIINNKGHGITINDRLGPVKTVKVEKCTYSGNGMRPLNYWGWSWWQEALADLGLYKPTSITIP